MTRRTLLATASAAFAAPTAPAWNDLARRYPVDRSLRNFNHAGVGTTPQPVLDAVLAHTRTGEACAPNTIFSYGPRLEPIRAGLAQMLAVSPEEIAITRNATESLHTVLLGLPLKAGDEVLTTTLDYWAMLDALEQRHQRDGVITRKLRIPVPCTNLNQLIQLFADAITPRTRLILLSHPINLNGQLFPVRDICRLAHARGIEVVVDAAQSFGLVNYTLADLECDYLGTSLHKWLHAPKGTGLLYVRRERIAGLWPLFASGHTRPKGDIRKFELYGTWPETILAIGDAVQFHNAIGAAAKEARHREMTRYWLSAVADLPRLKVHTPTGPQLSCGITTISVDGLTGATLRAQLLEKHRIVTMDVSRRTQEFSGVRISPSLATTQEELDALVDALRTIARG